MVLPKSEKVAKSVSAGLETVAVRMPSNEVARSIIKECGLPLAAPSANLSGSPSPTFAEHVVEDLDGKIDAVVMSSSCAVGVESTVVSLAVKPPRVLRPGAVTVEQLKEVLPDILVDKAVLCELEKGAKAASPGMMYKHYSPRCQTFLFGVDELIFAQEKIRQETLDENRKVAVLCENDAVSLFANNKVTVLNLGSNEREMASNLYGLLRKAEEIADVLVAVEPRKQDGVMVGVMNRLKKACLSVDIAKDK
jgi:L-threonylcarbamoyladenylate synthase